MTGDMGTFDIAALESLFEVYITGRNSIRLGRPTANGRQPTLSVPQGWVPHPFHSLIVEWVETTNSRFYAARPY